ncbi:MAG: DNA polymerase III subunit epsilon [Gammaproteobacteria bacterium]|nr:DNA polymerase III subunit epsilon [Gammaproteobacteria bacterium]
MRHVVLDTETTGLEPEQGHRIIEIAGVEMIGRRLTGNHYHAYVRPEREIDDAAIEVHGLTLEFLADKPLFRDIAAEFLDFVGGSELIIHNAPFDVSFIDYELARLDGPKVRISDVCTVTDSLALARHKHPGQKNGLDALCRRYDVDNSARDLHGALLDAEILADVYLLMTGGQTSLFASDQQGATSDRAEVVRLPTDRTRLKVVRASTEELIAHEARLDKLDRSAETGSVWRRILQRGA